MGERFVGCAGQVNKWETESGPEWHRMQTSLLTLFMRCWKSWSLAQWPDLSCASTARVGREREDSDWLILGAGVPSTLLVDCLATDSWTTSVWI